MSPGGHLVTTVVACAAAGLVVPTGSPAQSLALVAGVAAGGFLIDVDHAVDYVLFDGQRDLRPGAFLRYYVEHRMERVVLALHSWELLALLGLLAWWLGALPLWGYLGGAIMHLALDIRFNGETARRNLVPFYSFAYRARHRFRARDLLGLTGPQAAPASFWAAFFAQPSPSQSPARKRAESSASRP